MTNNLKDTAPEIAEALTNADRIRAMSDEDMARYRVYSATFEDGQVLWYGDFEGYCISDELAEKLELDWLQHPAPEEGKQNV